MEIVSLLSHNIRIHFRLKTLLKEIKRKNLQKFILIHLRREVHTAAPEKKVTSRHT